MALTILNNGITYDGLGRQTLDSLIVATLDRLDVMPEHKSYASALVFTDTTLISPDQKYGSKSAPKGLSDISETSTKPVMDMTFWPKKGVYQNEIGGKFVMSYLFSQWARTAQTIKGAPESIQAELANIANQTRGLVSSFDIRYAEELVKVYTKGFSITADVWPGSATPKGLSLFNANHTINAGGVFSNIIALGSPYSSIATGTTHLQAALDLHKTIKDENGKKIKQPRGEAYILACSRTREVFWRQVLNDNSNFSGQGNNANQVNQFNFKGNLVSIQIIDLLGDSDFKSVTIGTNDMWFLLNPTYLRLAQAFRTFRLYAPIVKTYTNDETDELNTSIRAVVGVDHFGAEYGIVGSLGA